MIDAKLNWETQHIFNFEKYSSEIANDKSITVQNNNTKAVIFKSHPHNFIEKRPNTAQN